MRKLLIANRGEIARRVIRTARRMGIRTVAVYSDADADAPHVADADEAVHIGPSAAAESYLVLDKIIAAAKRTGADAVHPGYGFLSENAAFARALADAGITFIGAPAEAIEQMGLKDAAKALMKRAKVPVTPGYQGDDQSLQRMERSAEAVGYPLLIKAVAGGGGKGMRRVDDPAEFSDALMAAQREGQASFGNDRVLLEKFITRPRHVEVQVFGDTHGNVVHLFERDCSLQRRHQKVLEEAPAPGLSAGTRKALGEAAVQAAKAISYVGAGTIEFILDTDQTDADGNNPFYFMEMNTRLQVEHPVTEAITGIDLVEWQIRVARGEPLPLSQDELGVSGHAIEARLYAEDPASGFLPSTGTLERLRFPTEGVRIDSGVEEGGEVTVHYDPMIAKVVVHGDSREEAIDALVAALDATQVEGLKTNRAFLARLADDEAFRSGDVHTGVIAEHLDALTTPMATDDNIVLAAAWHLVDARQSSPAATYFAEAGPWRMNLPTRHYVDLYAGDEAHHLTLTATDQGYEVSGLGDVRTLPAGGPDGSAHAFLSADGAHIEVHQAGGSWRFATRADAEGAAAAGSGTITAPMPGRILSLAVKAGDAVEAGDALLVLEAMKMENRLTAPVAGTVSDLSAAVGDQVAEGQVLMELVSDDEKAS